ncbi:unnamed protein product, partial [Tilletia laevis]
MQIKPTIAALACLFAAVPAVLAASAGPDGSLDTNRMTRVTRASTQASDVEILQRRGCTIGLGVHAGNVSINLSLQLLTDVVASLGLNVTDGLAQIARLDVSAVPQLGGMTDGVTTSIKTALAQLVTDTASSNSQAASSKRAEDDAGKDKLEENTASLLRQASPAFDHVQGLVAGGHADAKSVLGLQGVMDGLASMLIISRSMDSSLFDNLDVKTPAESIVHSVHLMPEAGLNSTLLTKVLSGEKLVRRDGELINIGFGLNLGPNVGAGAGFTVGPKGIGGGFNIGVGPVGAGGGIN